MKKPAVFLDRDGVINIPIFKNGRSYAPLSMDNIHFFPGVSKAIERLKAAGYFIAVVTNQPDVGHGKISLKEAEAINEYIRSQFNIHALKACYHKQTDDCSCRKPKPGMIEQLIQEHNLSRDTSFMVGDRLSDIKAGTAAKLSAIFIDLGYDESVEPKPSDIYPRVNSLLEATDIILSSSHTHLSDRISDSLT